MKPYIFQLIEAGEGETLDYKQTISDAGKIAKTMSAFANHKGGVLLVGVRDNQTIAGVKSEDEKYMLELAASFYCKPEVSIQLKEWGVEGKKIIECKVPEGTDKPYYAKDDEGKWWAYVRVKDQSLLASKVVLEVMKKGSKGKGSMIQYTHNEKALLDYLSKNNRITLKEYCQLVNISRRRATKIIINLLSAGIIRSHTTEKVEFYTL